MVLLWLFMVIRLCTTTPLDGWKVPGGLTEVSAPADTRSGFIGPWRSLGHLREARWLKRSRESGTLSSRRTESPTSPNLRFPLTGRFCTEIGVLAATCFRDSRR